MRIIIIDASRYDGLVVRNEMLKRYPEAVISHFVSLDHGIKEMVRTGYDVAVMSLSLLAPGPAETSRLLELLERGEVSPALVLIKSSPDLASLAQLMIASSSGKVQVLETEPSWHKLVPGLVAQFTADSVPKTEPKTADTLAELTMSPAGRAAHEINNPLMTILGATELVLAKPDQLAEDVLRKLKIIRRSAYRIKNYLDRQGIDDDHHGSGPESTSASRGRAPVVG